MMNAEQSETIKKAKQLLDAQTASLSATVRSGKIIVTIFTCMVILVCCVLHWTFNQYLGVLDEPKEIAGMVTAQIQDRIPDAGSELEKVLVQNAPDVAEKVRDSILEGIPQVRMTMEHRVNLRMNESVKYVGSEAERRFDLVLNENEEFVRTIAKASTSEEESREVVDLLTAEFMMSVDEALQKHASSTLDELLEETRLGLVDLNARLRKLADGKNLTRQEEMQRRLLGAVIREGRNLL